MSNPAAVGHDHGANHGTLKSYVTGFILSIVLTLISFWVVMSGGVAASSAIPWLVVLAVVQLLVQLLFFLHLGAAKAQRQNTGIFLFTLLLLAIAVGGSLWVMHNANVNMMHGL
jgi:cytochrome o ubiquinol oxidase operon protein cyoD